MIFIELPLFKKHLSLSDEELRQIQNVILEKPDIGDVIPGSKGLRKMRIAMPGRGKRGGAKVIYYWHVSESLCYLLLAYPKNEIENISDRQLNILAKLMMEEIGHE